MRNRAHNENNDDFNDEKQRDVKIFFQFNRKKYIR